MEAGIQRNYEAQTKSSSRRRNGNRSEDRSRYNTRSAEIRRFLKTDNREKEEEEICLPEDTQIQRNSSLYEQKIATSFSIQNLQVIVSAFDEDKRDLVRSIGFGSLLKLLPQSMFPRQLALWVIKNINSSTIELEIAKGHKLSIQDYDVELVLGIPIKSMIVKYGFELSEEQGEKIKRILMIQSEEEFNLEKVEGILTREYPEKMTTSQQNAFKVAFVLVADAYFLGPRGSKPRINQDMCKNLMEPSDIGEYNWCRYVLQCMLQSSKRVQQSLRAGYKTVTLECCLLFAVVYYLDNVDFGFLTPPKRILPRVQDYPRSVIKELEKQDREHVTRTGIAIYGRNKLLTGGEVIYTRNRGHQNTKKGGTREGKMQHGEGNYSLNLDDLVDEVNSWAMKVNSITHETQQSLLECFKMKNKECRVQRERYHRIGKDTECETDGTQEKKEEETPEIACKTKTNKMSEFIWASQGKTTRRDVEEAETLERKEDGLIMNIHLKASVPKLPRIQCDEGSHSSPSKMITVLNDTAEASYNTSKKGAIVAHIEHHRFQQDSYNKLREEVTKKLAEMGISIEGTEVTEQDNADHQENIECPTPLIIVPATMEQGIESYEEGSDNKNDSKPININDMKMMLDCIKSTSRFGMSPFAIGMTHPDATLEAQLAVHIAMRQLRTEDMAMNWYMHMTPTKIQIGGYVMQKIFQGENDFVPESIDAMMRLYKQMDGEIYSRWNEKRWRHFFSTSFAVWALHPERTDARQVVQEIFLRDDISYNILECRLVIAPILVHWCWCMYVCDFKRNKIVVLDPKGMKIGNSNMQQKHMKTIRQILTGMQECYEILNNDNDKHNIDTWEIEYIQDHGVQVDSPNTGLYALFYARYFDGELITRVLTKESTQLQRMNMMNQLLSMEGNIGKLPSSIVDAMYRWG